MFRCEWILGKKQRYKNKIKLAEYGCLIIKIRKIIEKDELASIRNKHKKIAFCTGCYDILQPGHIIFFNQCKEFADILVVGIGRDSTVRKLKGPGRPINLEKNRLFLIASLQDVDYAVLNEEEIKDGKIDFYGLIKELKPDFFILNDDDSAVREKKELCDRLGIELRLVPRVVPEMLKPTSSTEIIKKMKDG